jgi:hypothetical protein
MTSMALELRRIHLGLGTAQDTPGPSKTRKENMKKKTEEVQDVDSLSVRMSSITPVEEGDDKEGT